MKTVELDETERRILGLYRDRSEARSLEIDRIRRSEATDQSEASSIIRSLALKRLGIVLGDDESVAWSQPEDRWRSPALIIVPKSRGSMGSNDSKES